MMTADEKQTFKTAYAAEALLNKIPEYKRRLAAQKPVIHHITNFVTMYQCARVTAFLGAAPIMAFAADETIQVVSKSNALVVPEH